MHERQVSKLNLLKESMDQPQFLTADGYQDAFQVPRRVCVWLHVHACFVSVTEHG